MAIDFNIDAAFAKLGELVTAHGQQAIDLATQVKQVDAIGSVVGDLLALTVSSAVLSQAARQIYIGWKHREEYDSSWKEIGAPATGILFSILFGVVFLCGFFGLFDVWMWVSIFNPKLALAHDVYSRLVH